MGVWPKFSSLLQLFVVGLGLAMFGAWLFEKSRKGFADVL
jgi:ABC-type polysaccharide/polyol phosphate export permease